MRYRIEKTTDPKQMQMGLVTCYPWGGSYRPRTEFRIGYDDAGLHVHLRCEESNPRITAVGRNSEVWYDSCMEFFFSPGENQGYFNCEMNAYPSMLLYYGTSTEDEQRVAVDWPDEAFSLTSSVRQTDWSLFVRIPFAMIRQYVPTFQPARGTILRGNVYKCGDATEYPHFGCCFPIAAQEGSTPNFHVPEYFGEMELA